MMPTSISPSLFKRSSPPPSHIQRSSAELLPFQTLFSPFQRSSSFSLPFQRSSSTFSLRRSFHDHSCLLLKNTVKTQVLFFLKKTFLLLFFVLSPPQEYNQDPRGMRVNCSSSEPFKVMISCAPGGRPTKALNANLLSTREGGYVVNKDGSSVTITME